MEGGRLECPVPPVPPDAQSAVTTAPPAPTPVGPGRAGRELSGPIMTHAVISPFKPEGKKIKK